MIVGLNFGIELTLSEVLFGLTSYNNRDLKLTNFLILISKCFLNNVKTQNRLMYFKDFITLIKDKIEILKNIIVINNGDVESWESWVETPWAIV